MFSHTLRSYYSQAVHTKAVQKEALLSLYSYRYMLQLSSIRIFAICLSDFSTAMALFLKSVPYCHIYLIYV